MAYNRIAVALKVGDQQVPETGPTIVYLMYGYTYDVSGTVVSGFTCHLYKDNLDNTLTWVAYTSSDTSGFYNFENLDDELPQYLVVGWLDGAQNIFDVTDHTLVPCCSVAV